MDSLTILTIAIAAVSSALATAYGFLPDRIDLTFGFAAYGAGNIVGQILASRRRSESTVLARRWGLIGHVRTALLLALGGLLPS